MAPCRVLVLIFALLYILPEIHALPTQSLVSHAIMKDTPAFVIGISTVANRSNTALPVQTLETANQSYNGTLFFLWKWTQTMNQTEGSPFIKVPYVNSSNNNIVEYIDLPIEIKYFTSGNATADHLAMCADPEVSAVIGPFAPGQDCIAGANIVDRCGKFYITPCSLSYSAYPNYNYAFQVPTFAENVLADKMPIFRLARIKKVALLWGKNNPYTNTLCARGVSQYAPENDLEVTYAGPMIHDFISANTTDVLYHLDKAIASGANGLVLCVFPTAAIPIARRLKEIGFSFDLTLLAPDRNYPIYLTAEERDYFTVSTKSHVNIQYVDRFYTDKKTAFQTFFSEFKAIYGVNPDSGTGLYYYTMYLLFHALENLIPAGSVCSKDNNTLFTTFDMAYTLSRAVVPTLYSTMQFDSTKRCLSTEVLIQYRNGTSYVVAPVSASNEQLVTPAPKWSERVYKAELSSSEVGFIALAGVFIAFNVAMMIVVVIFRNTSLIRASMPQFLLLILLGATLIDIGGVILWGFHKLSTETCHIRVWFLGIGFILMFGCLITKSFRVWFIWSRKLDSSTVITNNQLSMFIGVALIAGAVLFIIYSAISDVLVQHIAPDIYRPGLAIEACIENTAGSVILYIMIAFALLIMVVGLVFAFLTRKIPFLAFNESKIILFSMYNVIFFTIIALIVIHVPISIEVRYILRSLSILLSSFLTVLIIMGTKLWYLSSDKNARSKKKSSSETGTVVSGSRKTTTTTASKASTVETIDEDD